MINLRTYLVPLFPLFRILAGTASLTGCAGANYEAQSAQDVALVDGRADQSIDDNLAPGATRRASADVAIGADPNTYSDTDPSALSDFREPLAPYGAWVDDSTYGTVWVPHASVVGSDFTPYATAGHWTYGDEWTWVSDYSWGWAPFHYGRWTYMGGRGWGWIPGRTYRGAWVSWRTGPVGYGYVGWAPMAPNWYWYNGYATGLYAVPPSSYVFCSTRHVFAPGGVNGHIVRGPEVAGIGAGTTPHTPATPSVDPHVRANPSVDGAAATRMGSGPKPESLGIANNEIARMPTGNAGLAQAQAFAQPSTAVARGAAAPATAMPYTEPRNMAPRTLTGASVATAPRFTPTTDLTRSAAPASPPSSFNASPSSQSSFSPAMTGPRYQGVEPRSSASFSQAPRIMPPTTLPDISRTYAGGPSRAPSQLSGPSGPSYSRAPTFSQPSSPSLSRACRAGRPHERRRVGRPRDSCGARLSRPTR